MAEQGKYVTNERFRRAVNWLKLQGKDITDRQIATDTGISVTQMSHYRNDHTPLSYKFITRFEEAFLAEWGYKLEFFENVNEVHNNLSEEQQAVVMVNTKLEKLGATLELIYEAVEVLKQQNEQLLKKVEALENRAKK